MERIATEYKTILDQVVVFFRTDLCKPLVALLAAMFTWAPF